MSPAAPLGETAQGRKPDSCWATSRTRSGFTFCLGAMSSIRRASSGWGNRFAASRFRDQQRVPRSAVSGRWLRLALAPKPAAGPKTPVASQREFGQPAIERLAPGASPSKTITNGLSAEAFFFFREARRPAPWTGSPICFGISKRPSRPDDPPRPPQPGTPACTECPRA